MKTAETTRRWREKNKEHIRLWRKRYNATHREANAGYCRSYYDAHRDQIVRQKREYQRRNPDVVRKSNKDYTARHGDKVDVRSLARHSLPLGKRCEDCREPARHRHHEDYDKPLEVVFLCPRCHGKRHRKERVA